MNMKPEKKGLVTRTGVSFEPELLQKFDNWIAKRGFPNRSEAIRYVIREYLAQSDINENPNLEAVGTLTYIFNHHSFDSSSKLTELQHDNEDLIISTMHAHVSHELCLETIILRGKIHDLYRFRDDILSFKGVISGDIVISPLE